jgi:hypothetical protein
MCGGGMLKRGFNWKEEEVEKMARIISTICTLVIILVDLSYLSTSCCCDFVDYVEK